MKVKELHGNVSIRLQGAVLKGNLHVPDNALGLVLFSHGSGSSRLSPRNNYVAGELQQRNVGTLLFDLLTELEDVEYDNRFNIDLLTQRLIGTTNWVKQQEQLSSLQLGYFGASTGAASALRAAARFGPAVRAVVSRGGRPDLAMAWLSDVASPTLFLVGEMDPAVLELNKKAYDELHCTKELKIVPGASHLFEEPGKLEMVARESTAWFVRWFQKNLNRV
ncbi:dienelactone hydrolase family protein [Robiginitalea sp. SC105]|uniref:dienelactone hydrolase family protein n=1 Tax=Robiginitalea sp. SC105 TaxID=2762332 RepID=UPI0016398E27|nr:dienelactone hydrolase family protein [Robiginitalea sp. SC105]MBC2839512.1 dienelactone hydrolase family protein [Robiginitalea sp. SC105]